MNLRKLVSFLIVWCLTGFHIFAQDVGIGQWKSYAPYRNAVTITQNEEFIFLGASLSIIKLAKDGTSVDFIGKEDGLSDSGISIIEHSPNDDVLIVAYENSNLDIIKNGNLINLNFILTNSNLTGDRSINHILVQGPLAYLSTAFGIVELDLEKVEFGTTVFTGVSVNGTMIFEGQIYASTDEGIYRIDLSNNPNIADFNSWTLLDDTFGFPPDYSSAAIESFDDFLYFGINGQVFKYNGDLLEEVFMLSGYGLGYLSKGSTHLIAGFDCNTGCNSEVVFIDNSDNVIPAGSGCAARSFDAIQVGNEIYFADLFSDLRKAASPGANCAQYAFDSPGSTNVSHIATDGDRIYISSGGRTDNGNNRDIADGIFFFRNNNWSSYNQFNVAEFGNFGAERDFIQAAFHPFSDRIYFANYYGGLLELDGNAWKIYNASNSSLQGVVGFEERVRVGSIAFDSEGNLWMTNHLASKPISVFLADGTWKSFEVPGNTAVQNITVDEFDNKWITTYGNSEGIIVFNEGDLNIDSDDQYKIFNAGNSELSTNRVNFIAVDLDGIVWAGTGEGVITFECGGDIFRESCRGTQRIVDVGSNRDLLLRTEDVQTIGIDGANRKWFGTTNGIFVQSADGETEIFRFNKENSPLYSDNIVAFAFDKVSGEVFIGSTGGVQSYRSNATSGPEVHLSSAKVFPNPVRPEYRGDIGISGLARDANVKITDIKGQLVFETKANGGTAIWDGKDFDGRRVASGVYLIFSTVQDDFGKTDALAAKVLFIK